MDGGCGGDVLMARTVVKMMMMMIVKLMMVKMVTLGMVGMVGHDTSCYGMILHDAAGAGIYLAL